MLCFTKIEAASSKFSSATLDWPLDLLPRFGIRNYFEHYDPTTVVLAIETRSLEPPLDIEDGLIEDDISSWSSSFSSSSAMAFTSSSYRLKSTNIFDFEIILLDSFLLGAYFIVFAVLISSSAGDDSWFLRFWWDCFDTTLIAGFFICGIGKLFCCWLSLEASRTSFLPTCIP